LNLSRLDAHQLEEVGVDPPASEEADEHGHDALQEIGDAADDSEHLRVLPPPVGARDQEFLEGGVARALRGNRLNT
jgi:hypothetical protein